MEKNYNEFCKRWKLRYFYNGFNSRVVERITEHSSIDTSPSFSPDGKFIAFNSDRSGLQQIYVMRSDGSNVKRITFERNLWNPCLVSERRFNSIYKNA